MNAKELKSIIKKIVADSEDSLSKMEESALQTHYNSHAFKVGWYDNLTKNLLQQLKNISQ